MRCVCWYGISLNQTLSLQVLVRLFVVHVALRILHFFIGVLVEVADLASAEIFVQRVRIGDRGHLVKRPRIRNFQAPHAVLMSPLGEMTLERATTPVRVIAANLARVLHV